MHFSKPFSDSHLLADMAEPESRVGTEHSIQSRRVLQSYTAKCVNTEMGEEWDLLISYSGQTEKC